MRRITYNIVFVRLCLCDFSWQSISEQNQSLVIVGLKAFFPGGYDFPQFVQFGDSQTLQTSE